MVKLILFIIVKLFFFSVFSVPLCENKEFIIK